MGRPLPSNLLSEDLDNVVLGMPGAWAENVRECSDHYTTKVGGQPDFPIPLQELNIDLLKCGNCGGFLGLVAQIYAPLNLQGLKCEERTLYVFGCPTPSCGINPASWRTLRFQKQTTDALLPERGSESMSSDSNAPGHLVPVHDESLQLVEGETSHSRYETYEQQEASEWWDNSPWEMSGNEDLDIIEQENLSFGELESAPTGVHEPEAEEMYDQQLPAVESNPEVTQNDAHTRNMNEDASSSTTGLSFNDFPVLPCFYIYSHNESRAFQNRRAQSSTAEEESGEIFEEMQEMHDFMEGEYEGDDDSWGDDDYDNNNNRALLADRTYMKFKKRLDCYPEQCLRSCFGGHPLWASEQHNEADPCPKCGGPRVYEMQLMPPLLYFLQQACRERPPTSYGPIDWEWLTLLVFTCAQGCTQVASNSDGAAGDADKEDWTVVEEATLIQYEI